MDSQHPSHTRNIESDPKIKVQWGRRHRSNYRQVAQIYPLSWTKIMCPLIFRIWDKDNLADEWLHRKPVKLPKLGKQQVGLQWSRSCVDQINNLGIIIQYRVSNVLQMIFTDNGIACAWFSRKHLGAPQRRYISDKTIGHLRRSTSLN